MAAFSFLLKTCKNLLCCFSLAIICRKTLLGINIFSFWKLANLMKLIYFLKASIIKLGSVYYFPRLFCIWQVSLRPCKQVIKNVTLFFQRYISRITKYLLYNYFLNSYLILVFVFMFASIFYQNSEKSKTEYQFCLIICFNRQE